MFKKLILIIIFTFTLINMSFAVPFIAPGNFVPSREVLFDDGHYGSQDALLNQDLRYFIFDEVFKPQPAIPAPKEKKDGFVKKRNLWEIIKYEFDHENILNFHDISNQMNTPERVVSAVATGYLFDQDYNVYTNFDNYTKRSQFWKSNGAALSALGDAGVDLALFGLISLKGDEKSKQVAQMGAEGLLNINVQLAKRIVGMNRPSDTIANLGPSIVFDAFPSGHTFSVFTTATILGEAYNIKWLTYPIAYLSALSRIQQNTHWPSDLIVGGLMGHLNARYLMYDHNFIQQDKIRDYKIFDNTKMDISGQYDVYYDSNSGCVLNNPVMDRVGRLGVRWGLAQKLNDKMLFQTAFHYRGQIPQILSYNSVKDISYIPRVSYSLGKSVFAYGQYEDNRILYYDLGRNPYEPIVVQPPAGLNYIDNFHAKNASAGIVGKIGKSLYARGGYFNLSRNFQAFTNLNSRGGGAQAELGIFYPNSNMLAAVNFNFGSQAASDSAYSYTHRGLRLSINQTFLKYGTVKISYFNESELYNNLSGTAYWKGYGVEYKQDFYKDWYVNAGLFKKSLQSNLNNWGYTKMLATVNFSKEF